MFEVLLSDSERTTIAMVMASENFSMRDIVKYGLITLGNAISSRLYNFAESIPFNDWVPLVFSTLEQNTNLKELVLAGARILSRLNGPDIWYIKSSPLPSIVGEGCYLSIPSLLSFPLGAGFFSACLANGYLLGIDPHSFMSDDAISPFLQKLPELPLEALDGKTRAYHNRVDKTRVHLQQISLHGLTNDLRPTHEQLTIPHHPYLDVIPWPSFRARAIVASSMDPPLIDEGDLCLDLLNNGLYCYNMCAVSLHGRGEGTPWDCRSWEAKPWFMRKWSLLTSGPDVLQSSKWWRSRI
jgi:hypothetical protein